MPSRLNTCASASSTGALRSSGASTKCASIAAAPSSMSWNTSQPRPIAHDSPTADQTE